ncbi:hypothetical protein DPMN_090525 [Dreissena polymorpha]|uniref:Transcription factor CBF/NF-Y/archaeal histone domain-containing protein n=1 Tax=Dreissena polymorpha TaxID=45954 RepID=A0A9D4KXV5_DREPO|nr:hypothetical protein DPMN_090525 [Dreissena polymorpha]
MAGVENDEEQVFDEKTNNKDNAVPEKDDSFQPDRLVQLPLTRIKHIIKLDPDVTLASSDAVIAITKATELFVQMMAKDAAGCMLQSKRKTLQRKDLDHILERRDCYLFLDGAVD